MDWLIKTKHLNNRKMHQGRFRQENEGFTVRSAVKPLKSTVQTRPKTTPGHIKWWVIESSSLIVNEQTTQFDTKGYRMRSANLPTFFGYSYYWIWVLCKETFQFADCLRDREHNKIKHLLNLESLYCKMGKGNLIIYPRLCSVEWHV